MTNSQTTTVSKEIREIDADVRPLNVDEIDDVAGAGWLRDAYNWVKKHVTRGPGDYGIAVKGTHDIGK